MPAVFLAFLLRGAELIYELFEFVLVHEVGGEVFRHIAPFVAVAFVSVEIPYGVKLCLALALATGHEAEFACLDADMAVARIYIAVLVICGAVVFCALNSHICTHRKFPAVTIVLHARRRKVHKIDSGHFFVPLIS